MGLLIASTAARADDYSDLLDILRAKGTLSQGEYDSLLSHHLHKTQVASHRAGRHQQGSQYARQRRRGGEGAPSEAYAPSESPVEAAARAQQAAEQAAASAAAAEQSAHASTEALNSPDIVRAEPYVPGKGITVKVGSVDVNLSGFINGFYSFNSSSSGGSVVAGGLSTGGPTGFDSSSVRNGLLPAGLILKLSTVQDGIDLSAVFGAYPGLNDADSGALNANSGGSPVGLGTAGIDFRQVYVTVGTKQFGTVKIGRDIGLFGSDAILNDATLLSVGSTGSNAAPANTALGRIGIGYIYADWIPQITYISPTFAGFQGSVGVFTPLDEFNFAGDNLSATNTQHSVPMFQGKLTYDWASGKISVHAWTGFLVQPQDHLEIGGVQTDRDITAAAGEGGLKFGYGPYSLLGYYYRGSGVGTTGLFFDGIAQNGNARDSEGFYAQGGVKVIPKLKLVASYGQSGLNLASGEVNPTLVRLNQSEIGAAYYSMTSWLTVVGEFAHTTSRAHSASDQDNDNTVSLGAFVMF